MATFSDDFSTHSTSDVANNSTPTGISGWTWSSSGSSTYQNATIVSVGGALGGQVLRINDTGWGQNIVMYVTALGSVSGAVEALAKFRVTSISTDVAQHRRCQIPCVKINTASLGRRNAVGLKQNAGTVTQQLWYFQDANEWTSIGGSLNATSDFAAGTWRWVRVQVNASNEWLWRSWNDGDTEPTSWVNTATTDTTVTSGYLGLGMYELLSSGFEPIDIDYIAFGTGGDAAPEPGGGGGGEILLPTFAVRQNTLLRM